MKVSSILCLFLLIACGGDPSNDLEAKINKTYAVNTEEVLSSKEQASLVDFCESLSVKENFLKLNYADQSETLSYEVLSQGCSIKRATPLTRDISVVSRNSELYLGNGSLFSEVLTKDSDIFHSLCKEAKDGSEVNRVNTIGTKARWVYVYTEANEECDISSNDKEKKVVCLEIREGYTTDIENRYKVEKVSYLKTYINNGNYTGFVMYHKELDASSCDEDNFNEKTQILLSNLN